MEKVIYLTETERRLLLNLLEKSSANAKGSMAFGFGDFGTVIGIDSIRRKLRLAKDREDDFEMEER